MSGLDPWRELHEQRPGPQARRFTLVRESGDDVAGWFLDGCCELSDPDGPPPGSTVAQVRRFYGGERRTRLVWENDDDPL
ncbi:hypothetical protein ACIRPQ_29155 [Streptomyces sp. NPDC101213]|uniref:hypothetical protein n=1 Tax=Streptomyces sp. NPDC101213 TaxID=3366130 RepID=UPI00381A2C6D